MLHLDGTADRPLDVIAMGSLVFEQVALVERWPERGGQDVVKVSRMAYTAGGCAMNVAAFLGRFGVATAILSTIGTGRYSQPVWQELERSGVDPRFLKVHQGREGSLIFIMSNPSGDWAVLDHMDPRLRVGEEDIPGSEELAQARLLHIDGFSFVSAGSEAAVKLALQRAREAGCLVSVDCSVPAAKNHRAFLRWLCEQADILYLNQFEGLKVTGAESIKQVIERLQSLGPRVAYLKLGESGSYVITPRSVDQIPAFEVEVVDTVAAGDSYIAASLLLLLQGQDYQQAALHGAAAGALACLGAGSLSSRFTLADVEALIQRGPQRPHNPLIKE